MRAACWSSAASETSRGLVSSVVSVVPKNP